MRFLVGAIAIVACASALGVTAQEEEVREVYARGLAGDKPAVDECITKLEAGLQTQPNNQLARVYLGSAYTLRSRDLGFGPTKLTALRHGLALMDEAVQSAPDQARVRLLRALTTQALPAFFARRKSAQEDFIILASLLLKAPRALDPGEQQTVFYQAGLAAKQSGDAARALEFWRKATLYPVDAALAQKVNAARAGK